ncbi:hypothetical protein MNBD_GAMMA16-169 [hydrothermal vent metagenome]|uniref:Immunity MXAN-0049 protein domain-containing protein n=1 Tax=hydrothermal vent metagenome TaxID=652676 RepID=A0A3B0Z0P4_9ZZZZ
MTYWVLFPEMLDDSAVLSAIPDGGPEDYQYNEGEPLLPNYPSLDQAIMVFDSIHYPDQSKLYDIVPALDAVLVINNKVKNVLNNMNVDNIEYLPIRLWDHQKSPVSDDYYILNPLGSVDFIDMEKSECAMSALNKGQINDIDDLVINMNKVPKEAKLFRATTMMRQVFIHDDLRIALGNEGIQGYKLIEAEGWDGLDF